MKYSGTLIVLCVLSFAVLIGLNIMNAQERREDVELHKTVEAQINKEIEELRKEIRLLKTDIQLLEQGDNR
jgi:cell division protein FtsB